jgi:hypothetical protein
MKMSQAPPPSERFNLNMNEFFKLLKSLLLKSEKQGFQVISMDLFDLGHNIAVNADTDTVILLFTKRSYPHWNQILQKNDDYFTTNLTDILSDVPGIEKGGSIFKARCPKGHLIIDAEDREVIWSYLTALIKTSIRYCQQKNYDWYDIPTELKRWNLK